MPKYPFLIVLLGVSTLNLQACSTAWFERELPRATMKIKKDTGESGIMTSAVGGYYPRQTSSLATNSYSNGSVEVYGMGQQAGMTPIDQSMQGGPMMNYGAEIPTGDSSVTVYSLDSAQMIAQPYNGGALMSYGAGRYYGGGNQIYFNHGSARLGSIDKQKLSAVANQAQSVPRITVAGHASKPTQAGSSSVQSHILNLKESMNRSFAVSKELMQKGVPGNKIKTVSWGSAQATGNDTRDRRVDVVMDEQ